MSILVYSDKQTAATAAATLVAAQLIEKPSSVLGIDYDEGLKAVYASLSAMTQNGMLDWSRAKLLQLCEYALGDDVTTSVLEQLQLSLYEPIHLLSQQYIVPPRQSDNWSLSCNEFEESILDLGGMDLALVTVKDDGSVLFIMADGDIAPITHVEVYNDKRAVSAGITTLMMARKIVVLVTGKERASVVSKFLKGTVTSDVPASFLQLHGNATFLFDEDAASML
ncbi:MAG: 6-phosphogluconolactonase [Eubacteriales bacterium]|nr:6-phosphogluconolactonase [Eubacteriales bacterium]